MFLGGYRYSTRSGAFLILVDEHGKWHALFEDEHLDGPFLTAQHALDDLAGGHTPWPNCGDPSRFGLPDEIGDWTPIRAR